MTLRVPGNRPSVLIFKKELLSFSETFVASQPRYFRRYSPVFAGFYRRDSGLSLLEGYPVHHFCSSSSFLFALHRGFHWLGFAPTAWERQMRPYRPVIVHAQFGQSGVVVASLARHLNIPLVVTFQGVDITARKDFLYRWRRRRLYRQAAAILGVGRHLCERLKADGCPASKVHYLTTGVDTQFFCPAPEESHPEGPVILFVGRLVEKKGVSELIEIFRLVRQKLPKAQLHVAGDGPLRRLVEGAQPEFGSALHFYGALFPEKTRQLYQRAHLLLAPGKPAKDGNAEGLPTVLLEAQAAGLPPVAFNTAGVNEAVEHGQTGWLVPVGEVPAFAEVAVGILRNPQQRTQLAAAARERVVRNFDIRRQSEQLEALYDTLLPG
jgi:colanic acid/amylovoran biosynthesis glycosyltransferase